MKATFRTPRTRITSWGEIRFPSSLATAAMRAKKKAERAMSRTGADYPRNRFALGRNEGGGPESGRHAELHAWKRCGDYFLTFLAGFRTGFFAGLPETVAPSLTAPCAAARRAIGIRNGEQET